MENKADKTFPLRGVQVHRPFDKTSASICEDSNGIIKRRTLSSRLQCSEFFNREFYSLPNEPSEYRFLSATDEKETTPYTLNFHWESIPLLRVYYKATAKWDKLKLNQNDNVVSNLLLDYKTAMEEEKGRFFSDFRDTDPLYCNIIIEDLILKLLPERISLLILTTILGSNLGGIGRLMASIQMLDRIIDENIYAIIENSESSDSIVEIINKTFRSFNFDESVRSLYERLEKERPAEQPNATYKFKGKKQRTFGIKTYSEASQEDNNCLSTIFEYLEAADKDSEKNKCYFKKRNEVNRNDLKELEKKAEDSYDMYRANHLPEEQKKRAADLRNAVSATEKLSETATELKRIYNDKNQLAILLRYLILEMIQQDEENDTIKAISFVNYTFYLETKEIANKIKHEIYISKANGNKQGINIDNLINSEIRRYIGSIQYRNHIKSFTIKNDIQKMIFKATDSNARQADINQSLRDTMSDIFMLFCNKQ